MQERGIVDGKITWRDAHDTLARIAKERGRLDLDQARWLLVAEREAVHRHLGFATFLEYLERALGYTPRAARERMRVAGKLVELPVMRAALADGRLSYSAVRELSRVAKASTDAAWTAIGIGKSVREIEEACRGRGEGDLPTTPPRPDLANRVVRFEMSPETYALWREARNAVVGEAGASLDDDAALAAIFRRALRATATDGAPYQIERRRHRTERGTEPRRRSEASRGSAPGTRSTTPTTTPTTTPWQARVCRRGADPRGSSRVGQGERAQASGSVAALVS